MKKKITIKIFLIVLAVLAVLFIAIGLYWLITRYNNSYTFEKRMRFSLPDYAEDMVELEKEITGEEESVDIKFNIPEEKLSDFIDLITEVGYYEYNRSILESIPHPERTCEAWDLDYKKLDTVFYGYNTRNEITFWLGKVVHRCHIYFFILKPENGKVQIYLSYNS